jgi:hypothetical protein
VCRIVIIESGLRLRMMDNVYVKWTVSEIEYY